MICTKCGENNLDDARFCKKCGTPLEAASPTPAPPAAPSRSPLEGLGSPSETPPTTHTSVAAAITKTPEANVEQQEAPLPPAIEAKAVDSVPPPPIVEQPSPSTQKSQKKPVIMCLSIVGIAFLLFMLLIVAAICTGNGETRYLSAPGDSSTFTVDVTEPVQVTFEVPDDAQFNVKITGPQGDLVGDWAITPYNNVFVLQRNGTYTFIVYSVAGSGWWKAKW